MPNWTIDRKADKQADWRTTAPSGRPRESLPGARQ